MIPQVFWLGLSFFSSLAATLLLSGSRRSIPFYLVLLFVLFALFGVPALPAFGLALAYRYHYASRQNPPKN